MEQWGRSYNSVNTSSGSNTRYMKSVIYFHDVQHLSQIYCHFISSNAFSYNAALNIWTQISTTCSSRETSCVIWCFYIFSNTSYLYSECTLSDHWPGHQIQCISSKWRLGKYLRNASIMGWEYLPIEGRQLSNNYMCKHTYHSHYSDCASNKCSSGWHIWDFYFHRYLVQ
jgi:hypothetical protein